ncbi:hypothetical protein SprV_0100159100 [Sparganum proliferum]
MVSFDVVSLFTSIPQALAVEILSDLLRKTFDGGDGQLTSQDLIQLMGHCLKTFFTFEGITCQQIKGTPMGSLISRLISEAVLQKLEKRLFEEYKPKFWTRNVDDTLLIIDQDKINYYEKLLNLIIPDLQFTMEEEVESKLPFLDVLLCRQPDGKQSASVYRKPTNMLQMLSYNSNHSLQHKRNCVRMLYRRVGIHCSTPAAKLDEIKLLQELFRANGYPRTFVDRRRRQPRKGNGEHVSLRFVISDYFSAFQIMAFSLDSITIFTVLIAGALMSEYMAEALPARSQRMDFSQEADLDYLVGVLERVYEENPSKTREILEDFLESGVKTDRKRAIRLLRLGK